ncbi:MAG: T9SS type A sorting domain-containing protein [Flavobacteriia bacterium]|nr:T9SS type A sorting domain-containing protein [Flavobacteriia bacterium]
MKKLLLLTLLPAMSFAQTAKSPSWLKAADATASNNKAFVYVFSNFSSAYNDLTNQDYTLNGDWDDPYISLAPPFTLTTLGMNVDSIYMDYGSMLYGKNNSMGDEVLYSAMSSDLANLGMLTGTPLSPISYVTEGSAPNRIFKFEWRNAGFYDEMAWGTNNNYVNVQVWLYENGTIEYHYGPNQVSSDFNDTLYSYSSLVSGLAKFNNSTFEVEDMHLLRGNSASPNMVDSVDQVTSWPANGTVYKFALPGVGIEDQQTITVKLYPNPAINELRVQAEPNQVFDVVLLDMSGQVVKRGELSSQTAMSIAELPAGVYLTKLIERGTGESQTLRLVIQQ